MFSFFSGYYFPTLFLVSFVFTLLLKAIGLLSKTTTMHVQYTLWYISLPLFHNYNVKLVTFTLYERRCLSHLNLKQEKFANSFQCERGGIRPKKFEGSRIHSLL